MNVEHAWQALREDEARVVAPASVDDAVMAAWNSGRMRDGRSRTPGPLRVAAVLAAAAALVAVAALQWRSPVVQAPVEDPAAAPLMTLAADPVFDGEPLQLVRVRMPRSALRALGVALLEPEAGGVVDVDVVVGGDGLPREIRRVTAVRVRMEEGVR